MRYINLNRHLPQAVLATVITVLVVASIASATTIGTNVSTDGTLTVTDNTTLASTTISYLTFGNATSSAHAIVGPDTVFTVDRNGAFKFEGNGLLGAYSDSIVQMVGELQIGPLLSPYTTINNNITTSGALTVSGTTTIDNGLFYVDVTNGRVGIGTSNPSTDLHLSKNGSAGFRLESTTGDSELFIDAGTNGTSRIKLGTTTNSHWYMANTLNDLFVLGSDIEDVFYITKANSYIGIKDISPDATLEVNGTFMVSGSGDGDGDRLTIDSSGNIGIGTTTPNTKLDVNGTIAGDHLLRIKGLAGGGASIQFEENEVAQGTIQLDGSNNLQVSASNFNIINANVGIGTTTPQYKLDVSGDLRASSSALRAINFAIDSEATDSYVINPSPALTSYNAGLQITFIANTANTGACTVNVNGLGAKSLKMKHDQDPYDDFIESGSVVVAVYDGTNFQMIHPSANPIGSGNAALTWAVSSMSDDTVVPSQTSQVLYRATLTAGSASDVKLTSVKISATSTGVNPFTDSNISSVSLYLDGNLLQTRASSIVEGTGGTKGSITFSSLNSSYNTISAGSGVTLELRADFASSFASTGTIELGIAHASDDIAVQDVDSNNVDETLSDAVDTSSRMITLVDAGELVVDLLINDTKANQDIYILAGSETTSGDAYIAKLNFTAYYEDITLDEIILGQLGTASNDDIANVKLYNSSDVEVASQAPNSSGHVLFDNLSLTLPADTTTSYFIAIDLQGINVDGDPSSTADYNESIRYTFASSSVLTALGKTKAINASGDDTGINITMTEATSATVGSNQYASWNYATSTIANVTASLLTSITNSMSDGVLTNGVDENIGQYTFVFNNGSNRYTDNSDVLAEMNQLVLNIATTTGVNITNVQAYNISSPSEKTTAVNPVNGVATIDLTSLTGTGEQVDGSVELYIEADITGVGSGDTVQTSINDLSTDFTYNGYSGDGSVLTDTRLTIISVSGATLEN